MPRKKWDDNQLREAIQSSRSLRQVALKLGLCARGGGCYYSLKDRIKILNIDTSHFKGQSWLKGCRNDWSIKPVEYYLVVGKLVNADRVKRKLIENGTWENKCSECGQKPIWNNKKLVLQLDHKDGDRYNNVLANLRLLCPNCHTQTITFTRTKQKKEKILKNPEWRKFPKFALRKCEHPTEKELDNMIKTMSWCAIGRKFGVSDNAVRKWAKGYGLLK